MPRIHTRKNSPKFNDHAKLEAVAKRSGIAVRTLIDYQKNGCDIYDDDAIREHIRAKGILPRQLNSEWYGVTQVASKDIEGLKDALLKTTDRGEASRIKTQIEGLLTAQKLEVLNGSYISIHEERDAYTKLGAILKTCINRLSADLPPVLEGLDPSAMSKKITLVGDKMLAELSEGKGGIWD